MSLPEKEPGHGNVAAPVAVLVTALVSRVIAAFVLQSYVDRLRPPRLCVFPDTNYYWLLARAIRLGRPYEIVEWGTISFKAMRTPGYPLFLAGCQAVLGESPLGVRLVQAVLGTVSVGLVYLLARRFERSLAPGPTGGTLGRTASLAAAILAAIDPYYVGVSELILSEAFFIPLMLASVWGIAVLWRAHDEAERLTPAWGALVALASGAAGGAAILVKPSFALFLPCVLVCWIAAGGFSRDRRLLMEALRIAFLIAAGAAVVMSPWWVADAKLTGGLSPHRSGSVRACMTA